MHKVLMVEEEIDTVKRSLERLTRAGFEMISAYDGCLGLQIAKDKTPDLIITDAAVPVMNGYELCKAIKLDEQIRSIPIVVMTEKNRQEESFRFLGINDFLNEPVNMDDLEHIVRKKFNQFMHLQKSKILIYGRPEVLACCEQLLKKEPNWLGQYSDNKDSFLELAVSCVPDVIMMDFLIEGTPVDEIIEKLKSIPELKNTVILTYYTSLSVSRDAITIQAQMIEVQYMKRLKKEAGAKEYLGAFSPVTFLNLINIYRKDASIVYL